MPHLTVALMMALEAVGGEPPQLPYAPPAERADLSPFAPDDPAALVSAAEAAAFPALDDRAAWMAQSDDGLALGGTDPVSYFEPGGPQPGRPDIAARYHGAEFRFASPEHRDLFLAAPERFAPALGGHDPEALAQGVLLPADPDNWTIVDGRLFLSGSPELRREFDRHAPEVVRAAQEKWRAYDRMFEDRFFKAHTD